MAEADYSWMLGTPSVDQNSYNVDGIWTGPNESVGPNDSAWYNVTDPVTGLLKPNPLQQYIDQGYTPTTMSDGRHVLIRGDMQSGGIDRIYVDAAGNTTYEREDQKSFGDKLGDALESAAPYLVAMATIAYAGPMIANWATGASSAVAAGGSELAAYTAADLLPGGTNAALGATTGAATASGVPALEALATQFGITGADTFALDQLIAQQSALHPYDGGQLTGISADDWMMGNATPEQVAEVNRQIQAGFPAADISRATGIPVDVLEGRVPNPYGQSPTGTQPGGTRPPTGAPTGTGQQPGTTGNLTGNGYLDGLMKLLSGVLGAQQQNSLADKLLARADAATPNRTYFEDLLRGSYENPQDYLKSPEVTSIMNLTQQKLQSSDAAGGRLANDIGRQTALNDRMMTQLGNYRTGLSRITSDKANTYTGNNGMFQTGAALDSSANNNILQGILSMLGSGTGGATNGVANTFGTDLANTISRWFSNPSMPAPATPSPTSPVDPTYQPNNYS